MNVTHEEDRIPTTRVVIALALTIGLTIACLVWVWAVMKPFEASAAGKPRTPRPQEVAASSDVDRTLYTWGAGFAAELLARKRAELESWGWVDKSAGLVHIPIERAMEVVVEEDHR